MLACILATIGIFIILFFVGFTGILAAWTGVWPGDPPQDGENAFFLLIATLPDWVNGFVIVFSITLSCAGRVIDLY